MKRNSNNKRTRTEMEGQPLQTGNDVNTNSTTNTNNAPATPLRGVRETTNPTTPVNQGTDMTMQGAQRQLDEARRAAAAERAAARQGQPRRTYGVRLADLINADTRTPPGTPIRNHSNGMPGLTPGSVASTPSPQTPEQQGTTPNNNQNFSRRLTPPRTPRSP